MTAQTKIVQTYYISTGAKNSMYTLRCRRDAVGQSVDQFAFMPDFYLCNLAATEDKAIDKAREYVDAMRDRIGEREDFRIVFEACPDCETYKRIGKLSAKDSRRIRQIEAGTFPFGKHSGTKITDAPASYVLFFADKCAEKAADMVMQALSAACMGVALERGLIAKRDERRALQAEQDALSCHIGTVGERREFEGELVMCYEKRASERGETFTMYVANKVRCGNDIVTYIGAKALGERGSTVKFRATIKAHLEHSGIKTTKVNRPHF